MIKILKNGFTLIELLVVISLIGILASLALVSFTSTQKQARDTKRKSDLRQYQTSLENFSNNNNYLYPSKATTTDISSMCDAIGITGECPIDPKSDLYIYSYITNGTGVGNTATDYVLWATMESSGGYFIVCSTGKVGQLTTAPSSFSCPI